MLRFDFCFGFAGGSERIGMSHLYSVLEFAMNPSLRNPNLDLQFSIGSIMCTTGTFAVLLTYLRAFAPEEFLMGLLMVFLVAILGGVAGCFWHRVYEATLWSSLGALTAFLCAVGEPLTHNAFNYAWPLVGAATAASAILLDDRALGVRMAIGASIATVILAAFAVGAWSLGAANTWMEVVCGPIAGAIMVAVVWMLEAVRVWRSYSRATMIFTLTLGVVGGNLFGRWIGWL